MSWAAARRWILVASFLALASCGDASNDLRAQSWAVVAGVDSGPLDDGVVEVRSPATLCSGTAIANNLVITSLACISLVGQGTYWCGVDGSIENEDTDAGNVLRTYAPEQIEVRVHAHPANAADAYGRQVIGTGAPTLCAGDLAAVVLDRALDIPSFSFELERLPHFGDLVSVVGYGRDEGLGGPTARRRRNDVRIVDIDVPPGTLAVGTGPCGGDGGGPAIAQDTGAVLGVNSLVVGACLSPTVRSIFTRLSAFPDLVLQAVNASGMELESSALGLSSAKRPQGSGGCAVGRSFARSKSWLHVCLGPTVVLLTAARRRRSRKPQQSMDGV